MKEQLAVKQIECQDWRTSEGLGNELEEYADKYADSVFIPLAEFDLFWLSLIENNQCYWAAETRRIIEKWSRPEEEEQVVKKHTFVQVFPNPNYERKT